MTLTTFLVAFAAYFVLTLGWAMLWNVVLFKKTYHAMAGPSLREEPVMPLGMAAIAVQATALAILFSLFYRGVQPAFEGVRLTLLVEAFSIVYGAFVAPAKFQVNRAAQYAGMELVYGVAHAVAAGLILAFIFGWDTP